MIDVYAHALIRGYNWKARMFNGAVFEFWTPGIISRSKAREAMLNLANGYDYFEVYSKKDIEQLWFNKNVKK